MNTYKTKTIIKRNHKIEIENLPFDDGEEVEIIISQKNENGNIKKNYLMIGEPLTYIDPYKPVAEDDRDVLK